MTSVELRHRNYREAMSAIPFVLGVASSFARTEARWPLLFMACIMPTISALHRFIDWRFKS